MKKSKLLIVGIFFALSFLAYTPAHASGTTNTQNSSIWDGLGDWWNSIFGGGGSGSGSGSTGSTGSTGSGSTSLPINNNAWFLVIAGTAVGYRVIMKSNKNLALEKI